MKNLSKKLLLSTKWLVACFILCYANNVLIAENIPKLQDPQNPFIIAKATLVDGGVVYYKNQVLMPGTLFNEFKEATGLGSDDNMVFIKTTHDEILKDENSPSPDYYHTSYQQYYKGIKVFGSVFTEHHRDGFVEMTSGYLVEGLNLNHIPALGSEEALVSAKSHIGGITYQPTEPGELIIIPVDAVTAGESVANFTYKLAWEFRVIVDSPRIDYDYNIFIDANTGVVLKEIRNGCLGDFNHLYYGFRGDLDTRYKYRWWNSDLWFLHANDNSRNIYTTDYSVYFDPTVVNIKPWAFDDMPDSDGDDHWGNDNWSATASHYCAQKAWDYFKQTPLNRNGMTGWGRHVRVVSDAGFPVKTGYTQRGLGLNINDYIYITRMDEMPPFNSGNLQATYDIVGHEFTHGIIKNSALLPYASISGAINESFSDIFGFMIERYMNGGITRNWTIGEDCGYISRDMQNPNNYGGARFYLQNGFWKNPLTTSFDDGGVHFNSGVQNKWFNLLSMGGSQNVNGQIRGCGGIGPNKAARIAYQTMINGNNYSGNNTTFDAVRANSILAAVQLYGMCSDEFNQTRAAWYAVNVGPNSIPCNIGSGGGGSGSALHGNTLTVNEPETVLDRIAIYPNPASESIIVVTEERNKKLELITDSYKLTIIDMSGKVVFSNSYNNINDVTINISSLSSGIFIVNIVSNSWIKNIKFVKK